MTSGNADAFVYDLFFCTLVMAMEGKNKLFYIDKPFTYEPFAVRKGDHDFLNWLNNYLREG